MAVFRTIFVVFAVLFAASQAQAQTACAPFPKSVYLGDFTHEQVKSYIHKAHGGDWAPYLVALNKNLSQLEQLQRAGKGAVLRVQGQAREASATDIAKYVYMSRQWISVAECLAEQQAMAALNDFSTAAGSGAGTNGNAATQVSYGGGSDNSTEVASATSAGNATKEAATSIVALEKFATDTSGRPINVKITASCENGVSVFRVINTGAAWPDNGTFAMFRMDGPNRQQISARKMRLEAGDAKTFRVSKKQNHTGQVGFSVMPSWYEREFKVDSDLKCR